MLWTSFHALSPREGHSDSTLDGQRFMQHVFPVEGQSPAAPGIGTLNSISRQRKLSSEAGLLLIKQVVQHFKACALQNTGPRGCQADVMQNESFVVTYPWQTKLSQLPLCGTFQSPECVLCIVNPKRIVESAAFPELT